LTKLTFDTAAVPHLTQLWAEALDSLRHQMPRDTYDLHLRGSRVDASSNGVLRIAVETDASIFYLRRMTRNVIAPTLRSLGHSGPVEFVTAAGAPAAPPPAPQVEADALLPADRILPGDVAAIARYDLSQNNWTKHSRYLRFWTPLFNGLNSYGGRIALPVWQAIRDQFDVSRLDAAWTPPLTKSAGEWAGLLGCSSQKLMGVWRGCATFDAHLTEFGEPPAACGHCYPRVEPVADWPSRTKALPDWPEGRPTCRHWVPGVLETLALERWAYVVTRGSTSASAITVQVYLRPPLITPQQAEALPAGVAADHEQALRQEHGVDLAAWRQVDVLRMFDLHQDLSGLETVEPAQLSALAQSSFFLRLH
jgi:hypothetical protein